MTLYLLRKARGEIKKKEYKPGKAIENDTGLEVLGVYEDLEEAKKELEKQQPTYYLQSFPIGLFYVVTEYYITEIEADSIEAYECGEWEEIEAIAFTKEAEIKEDEEDDD